MQKGTLKALWVLVGVTGLAAMAAASYGVWPLLFPDISYSFYPVYCALDEDCDLRAGPCISQLPGGGSISLSIEPRSIPVMQPLQLDVQVEGAETAEVELDFRGVDMNMGLNRARLEAEADGRFRGEGILPVCMSQRMLWEARVLLETKRGLVAAPFRFWTTRPGI